MPIPDDKKAVQQLTGCANYLAKFLPSLSQIAEPLRRLTDKDTHFEWLQHPSEAFDQIKEMLTSDPCSTEV